MMWGEHSSPRWHTVKGVGGHVRWGAGLNISTHNCTRKTQLLVIERTSKNRKLSTLGPSVRIGQKCSLKLRNLDTFLCQVCQNKKLDYYYENQAV